jgi:hypothetical protein
MSIERSCSAFESAVLQLGYQLRSPERPGGRLGHAFAIPLTSLFYWWPCEGRRRPQSRRQHPPPRSAQPSETSQSCGSRVEDVKTGFKLGVECMFACQASAVLDCSHLALNKKRSKSRGALVLTAPRLYRLPGPAERPSLRRGPSCSAPAQQIQQELVSDKRRMHAASGSPIVQVVC